MFEEAVNPAFLKHLRGRFRRSAVEWLLPLILLSIVLALPVKIYFLPLPAVRPPVGILILIYGVIPALVPFGIYMLSTSFEFDGQYITCRRMGSLVAWRHEITGNERVRMGSEVMAAAATTLNYYCVVWPEVRRAIYITSDMRAEMKRYLTDI